MGAYIYYQNMCPMDYQRIYNQIIDRAKNRKIKGYTEKHHIIPKCMGGSNNEKNLVNLTAREHFICHMLLCEIHPEINKLRHALFLMAIGKNSKKENRYYIGARTYERLKIDYSKMLKGVSHSQETKNKKSKAMLKVWKNKSKEEKSRIGLKRWETRKKNKTDKVNPTQAKNISKSLKGRKITWDRKRSKPVYQYDLEGNFINEFPSISEAERQIGGDIKSACAGRQKTAGGFIWKYKED